jgi:hypothetical protein
MSYVLRKRVNTLTTPSPWQVADFPELGSSSFLLSLCHNDWMLALFEKVFEGRFRCCLLVSCNTARVIAVDVAVRP